ncbi:LIN52 protein, partial [Bucco capensis]|nr:LIN52 protein [Bucco capensis]
PTTFLPGLHMVELENDNIEMLKELGSLTTTNLMKKVRGLQNLRGDLIALYNYLKGSCSQLGLDESREMTQGKFLNVLEKPRK